MTTMSKAVVIVLALCCLTGCRSDDDKPELTPAQVDGIALSILAAKFNAAQTNWTVTITQRTNTP